MKAKQLLIGLVTILMASCQSVEKMIDTGHYDSAVIKSAKKLKGKKKLKTKYVTALEEAFVKATERDINLVKRLAASERSEDWASILDLYHQIDRRQVGIVPLLPIVSKDGYEANFQFVKVGKLITAAETKFKGYLKREAISLLSDGRQGDKHAARSAHDRFEQYLAYEPTDQEVKRMRNEALALGMVNVRVNVDNYTGHLLPRQMHNELVSQGLPQSSWITYSLDQRATADFEVRILLDRLEISPEQLRESLEQRVAEVEDGEQTILAACGTPVTDSLGNELTETRYIDVEAEVLTVQQFKSTLLIGEIVCRNLRSDVSDHLPIRSEVVFDHTASAYRGDERALRSTDTKALRYDVLPFPDDQAMFADAFGRISPIIRDKISESVFL